MNINTKLKKAAIGVAVAAAAVTATLATTTGPAAAAMGKGRVQLCSQGNYWSLLRFNGTNEATLLIPPGSCAKTDIPLNTYRIEVVGKWNTSDATFTMGYFPATPNDDPGYKVYTVGSTANGSTGFLVGRD
jgi:hypothetical protein